MKRLTLVLVPLLSAAPLAPALAQRAAKFDDSVKAFITTDAPLIAIRDVRVVPGDGGPAQEGQTIIVRDGRIESIGANLSVPADAHVIAGKDLPALPGLVMRHEHRSEERRVGQEVSVRVDPGGRRIIKKNK